jgi:hypothetical protein
MDRAPSWLWHGRGVLMTAADLGRWVRALDKGLILSPTARRKLFTIVATLSPGYGYGRGWFVRADSTGAPRVVFHGGDFGAYHSEVRLYPVSGRILVAFTNAAFRGSSMTETVLNQMLDVVRGDPNPLPPLAAEGRERAASIAGEYRASKHDAFIVTARGASLSVEPTGQRAADWLARGDTSGWRDRQAAGERALALVDAVNRGTAIAFRGVTPDVRRELADEWDGLTRVGGRLKSIQLLGTVTDANGGGQLSIVRLKFQRDSLLYGVGWAGDSLRYTIAGIQNRAAPPIFAPTSGTEWVSFDWSAETQLRFTTDGRGTMTLQTANGPVVFTRNRE